MTTANRKSWAETFREMRNRTLTEASANALKVFVALELFAGSNDGYAYPSVATLQEKTGIKKPHTIFAALKELEALHIVYRRKLISKIRGFTAPNLYRIGRPINELPERARANYILPDVQSPHPEPSRKGRYAAKRHGGTENARPEQKSESDEQGTSTSDMPPNGIGRYAVKRRRATCRETAVELKELEPIEKEQETPPLACSVGSRQVHAAEPVQEAETRKNGDATFSLATIEPEIQKPAEPLFRLPPALAYLKKHGKLPPYIADETHLLFDDENRYIGYIDRNGNRHDEWNNFESIQMAQQRMNREAIREFLQKEAGKRAAVVDQPVVEPRPPTLTREEKLKMLRAGTDDENVAERWSTRTKVPARIYLVKGYNDRAEAYKLWSDEQKGARNGTGRK
jgi:Helix-turn-helix domain